jgi:hypothetical protein
MIHAGHTPTSYLAAEYTYCLQRSTGARKQIALLAIDLYHAEVKPEYRELQFDHVEHAADPEAAIIANVRKVHDLFASSRTVRVPFSFGHFIARAIDQLYGKDCVEQIAQLMAGPKAHAPGSKAAIAESSAAFARESHEAIGGLIHIASNFDNLSESEVRAQIKETNDALRAAERLVESLEKRLEGVTA